MTEQTATMTYLDDIGALVQIQDESTVSRTVLKAEGVRLVLFAFDEGQVLTEHTAAMPVLLQTVSGRFRITGGDDEAEGEGEIVPGGDPVQQDHDTTRFNQTASVTCDSSS